MSNAIYAVRMAGDDGKKYQRIADDLRARIKSGEYGPGSKLPSRGELRLRHGVRTDRTVDQALALLRGEGLIDTQHGVGSFVREPPPEAEPAASEYESVMERVDELADEVRQLRGEVAALRQAREA